MLHLIVSERSCVLNMGCAHSFSFVLVLFDSESSVTLLDSTIADNLVHPLGPVGTQLTVGGGLAGKKQRKLFANRLRVFAVGLLCLQLVANCLSDLELEQLLNDHESSLAARFFARFTRAHSSCRCPTA